MLSFTLSKEKILTETTINVGFRKDFLPFKVSEQHNELILK